MKTTIKGGKDDTQHTNLKTSIRQKKSCIRDNNSSTSNRHRSYVFSVGLWNKILVL